MKIVIIKFEYLYLFSLIIPFLTLFGCFGCYYFLNHYKTKKFIPTISEMAIFYPESQIFGIGMTISSLLQLIIIYIRTNLFKYLKSNIIIIYLINFFGFIGIIFIILVSNILVSKNYDIHIYSTGIFFLCTNFYLIF